MIEVKGLELYYGEEESAQLIVEKLRVTRGDCLVLCGQSGSGKTSFIRLLNGLIPEYYPARVLGEMTVAGLRVGRASIETFSQTVASVFQNPSTQFFHPIVEHELVFPCENQGLAPNEIRKRLAETSRLFNLTEQLKQDLRTASGGEQERIAVATAHMQSPSLLVLDEPSASLDSDTIIAIRDYLMRLKATGTTLVIAEHALSYLSDLGDSYLYFEKGKACQQWSKEQWLSMSDEDRLSLGLRPLKDHFPQKAQPPLTSTALHVHLPVFRAGDKDLGKLVDLHFPSGKITALTGKNGMGKSTLAKIISGLIRDESVITIGQETLSYRDRLRRIAYVMQDCQLQLVTDSVRKELLLGNQSTRSLDQIVKALQLEDLLDNHPLSLSGGEQQRVLLGNALLSEKAIFIFDEPTSGLDEKNRQAFSNLLTSLKEEDNVIILITHDKQLIEKSCDYAYDLADVLL